MENNQVVKGSLLDESRSVVARAIKSNLGATKVVLDRDLGLYDLELYPEKEGFQELHVGKAAHAYITGSIEMNPEMKARTDKLNAGLN